FASSGAGNGALLTRSHVPLRAQGRCGYHLTSNRTLVHRSTRGNRVHNPPTHGGQALPARWTTAPGTWTAAPPSWIRAQRPKPLHLVVSVQIASLHVVFWP